MVISGPTRSWLASKISIEVRCHTEHHFQDWESSALPQDCHLEVRGDSVPAKCLISEWPFMFVLPQTSSLPIADRELSDETDQTKAKLEGAMGKDILSSF